ncbi:MAG: hypothetical protein KKB20_00650 [Proteobacteria bacterium]|nr:hypothetical protein [Pseudomonadota bacterium]
MEKKMEELADLLADEDTVLRGYIAVTGVKILGHKFMGSDRTLALNYIHNADLPEDADVLWCLVEKERGRAPLIYPVVSKPEED